MDLQCGPGWMTVGLLVFVGVVLGSWPQSAWSQSWEEDVADEAEAEEGAAAASWVQQFVVPEREVVANEVFAFSGYAPLGEQCPTVPAASTYATGRPGVDVIVYGMRQACRFTGVWWICSNAGLGACVFNWSASDPKCHIGTPADGGMHPSAGTSSPYGVRGDPVGTGYSDEIYPADHCSSLPIWCEGPSNPRYQITMTGVPSDAQWEICGDDCSIGGGTGDTIYGWKNRDRIFAGGGWDEIYGGEGSDCIFADDGSDDIHGEGCDAGYDEYLWGLNGDDTVDVTSGTCTRFVTGGSGWDTLVGGKGDDYVYGAAISRCPLSLGLAGEEAEG